MPANTTPIYGLTPNSAVVSIATANANLDGTGTIGTLLTAGANGSFVVGVWIKAIVTTTAGMVRLYVYDGANYFLCHEEPIPAITKSATVPAFETYVSLNKSLPSGYSLRASTEKAETFKLICEAFDY